MIGTSCLWSTLTDTRSLSPMSV